MEALTKADETMLLPLAQKMSKVLDRCTSKQVRTELVEGFGSTYGFDMSREESIECWLVTRAGPVPHILATTASHFRPSWV